MMTDILIRGVEMPNSCEKCPFNDYEQGFCFAAWKFNESGWPDFSLNVGCQETRNHRCPLVPLPEGHGRLGDTAIEIVNELHTERLDYDSEYLPLINALNRLSAYEDTGLEPEECAEYAQAEKEGRYIVLKEPRSAGVHRLEKIARADIEGRLLVLPCKVGDTVWFNTYKNNATECVGIQSHEVKRVNVCFLTDGAEIPQWEIGKTVFLTREDAEKALKQEVKDNG